MTNNDQHGNLPHNVRLSEAAFEKVFREYFAQLTAFCTGRFGFDADLSKEIVHSAFVRLWENREKLSIEQPLKSYLYKVVNNLCLDSLKHQRVQHKYIQYVQTTCSDVWLQNDESNIDFKKLSADVKAALDQLPEQMRLIFSLSRDEGLKYSEIAARLDISIKTVETQMSRALTKLRHLLKKYLAFYLVILFNFFFLEN